MKYRYLRGMCVVGVVMRLKNRYLRGGGEVLCGGVRCCVVFWCVFGVCGVIVRKGNCVVFFCCGLVISLARDGKREKERHSDKMEREHMNILCAQERPVNTCAT